jgi:hypothetical protein
VEAGVGKGFGCAIFWTAARTFVISDRVVFDVLGYVAVPQQADQIVEYLLGHQKN